MIRCVPIDTSNREQVNGLLRERWFSTEMVLRGEIVDMTLAEGFLALDENGAVAGLITYAFRDALCEILSLDSFRESVGIGSALVERVIALARAHHCEKVVLITTNDNLNAMRFYQKRGFDMARLYRNALETSRRLKPEIPLIGDEGIPLHHELEFEYRLR